MRTAVREPTPTAKSPQSLRPQEKSSGLRKRFHRYFPAMFAYVFSHVGDEEAAGDIVAEAFARVSVEAQASGRNGFRLRLFQVARDLVADSRGQHSGDGKFDGELSNVERELLSLVFDGELRPSEASAILGVPPDHIPSMLLTSLRKMRGQLQGASV